MDTYLKTEGEECCSIFQMQGDQAVIEEARTETESQGTQDVYFRLVDNDGIVKFETEQRPWKNLTINVKPQEAKDNVPVFMTTARHGSATRGYG